MAPEKCFELEDIGGVYQDTVKERAIKQRVLRRLTADLRVRVDSYFDAVYAGDATVNNTKFRQEMIALVHQNLYTNNDELNAYARWYIKLAYSIVRFLNAILPETPTVSGWMGVLAPKFMVVSEQARQQAIDTSLDKLLTLGSTG